MLENRSFDHKLGFSWIKGTDVFSGNPTGVSGLTVLSLLQFARSLKAGSAKGVIGDLWGSWASPPEAAT